MSYTIDFKDLTHGEHNFEFTVSEQLFGQYEGCEVIGGSCKTNVNLQKSESMLNLVVSIVGDVMVECDRCLEPCAIEIDFEAPLIVKFSDIEKIEEEYDGEVMWLPKATTTLDLTHYIYESIILSLPYQRVHKDGECNAEMLQKFRIISGEEFQEIERKSEEVENETLPKEEMAKLAELRSKMLYEEE